MMTAYLKTFLLSTIAAGGLLIQSTPSLAANYSAVASATPKNYSGKCPTKILFRGKITARRAGRVQYKWIRSDNANAPVKTIHFSKPGYEIEIRAAGILGIKWNINHLIVRFYLFFNRLKKRAVVPRSWLNPVFCRTSMQSLAAMLPIIIV